MHEQERQREILKEAGYAHGHSGSRFYVDNTNKNYFIRMFYAFFLAIAFVFLISLIMVFVYRKCLLGDMNSQEDATRDITLIRVGNKNLPPGTKI